MSTHSQRRPDDDHVTDLLPAYVNLTLGDEDVAQVRVHLTRCAACRDDLTFWTATAEATTYAATAATHAYVPPLALLEGVWATEDVPATPGTRPLARVAKSSMGHAQRVWAILWWQTSLLPRGIWPVSAGAIGAGVLAMLLMANSVYSPSLLGFVVPLVTAAAVAFIYGGESDPGLEIALATPTSPRLVLIGRLVLVLAYNTTLALAGTLLLDVLRGGAFASAVAVWVGPMLLLASVSLLLTVVASAVGGMVGTVGLWVVHAAATAVAQLGVPSTVVAPINVLWRTTPATLVVACLLVALAVFYVSRGDGQLCLQRRLIMSS